jgi:hypothetical protein
MLTMIVIIYLNKKIKAVVEQVTSLDSNNI